MGTHTPPDFFQVPVLTREYGLDFQARLRTAGAIEDDTLLETLAFAEGRLLSSHPFLDFNGRVTRIWLREILRRSTCRRCSSLRPRSRAARNISHGFELRTGTIGAR